MTMTPAQQTALESVCGRALSAGEIAAIDPLLDSNNRQDVQIAALLTAGQPDVTRSLRVEEVFDVLFSSGDYLAIKQAQMAGDPRAAMAFAVLADARSLGNGSVNLAMPATASLLDALEAEPRLLSQAGRAALAAAALQPAAVIPVEDVSRALNIAEGRMIL